MIYEYRTVTPSNSLGHTLNKTAIQRIMSVLLLRNIAKTIGTSQTACNRRNSLAFRINKLHFEVSELVSSNIERAKANSSNCLLKSEQLLLFAFARQ